MSVKNFLKSTLVLSLLIVSTAVFAQQPMQQRSPEERAQRQTQWMQKNLNLTEEQNKKIYAIMLYHTTKADDTKNMAPGPEKRADAQAIKRDKNKDLKAVLTGAQFDKYQQHVQEMKDKKMDRRAGGGGNGGY